jgi:hypothetical protein
MSNVQLKTISHVSVHKGFNGFVDAVWSVSLVFSFWIIIANKTVLTDFVFQDNERFDFTKWFEKFLNLIFFHINWNVFEIKIVDQFTES